MCERMCVSSVLLLLFYLTLNVLLILRFTLRDVIGHYLDRGILGSPSTLATSATLIDDTDDTFWLSYPDSDWRQIKPSTYQVVSCRPCLHQS